MEDQKTVEIWEMIQMDGHNPRRLMRISRNMLPMSENPKRSRPGHKIERKETAKEKGKLVPKSSFRNYIKTFY